MTLDVSVHAPEAWESARFDHGTGREYFPRWEVMRNEWLTTKYREELGTDLAEAKAALLNRIITLQIWCELQDWRFRAGKPLSDDYNKNATTLARLVKELGLNTPAKAAPTNSRLAAYFAGKAGNDAVAKVTPSVRAV